MRGGNHAPLFVFGGWEHGRMGFFNRLVLCLVLFASLSSAASAVYVVSAPRQATTIFADSSGHLRNGVWINAVPASAQPLAIIPKTAHVRPIISPATAGRLARGVMGGPIGVGLLTISALDRVFEWDEQNQTWLREETPGQSCAYTYQGSTSPWSGCGWWQPLVESVQVCSDDPLDLTQQRNAVVSKLIPLLPGNTCQIGSSCTATVTGAVPSGSGVIVTRNIICTNGSNDMQDVSRGVGTVSTGAGETPPVLEELTDQDLREWLKNPANRLPGQTGNPLQTLADNHLPLTYDADGNPDSQTAQKEDLFPELRDAMQTVRTALSTWAAAMNQWQIDRDAHVADPDNVPDPGPAPTPEDIPDTSPPTSSPPPGSVTAEWPLFCSWASVVCDFIDWFREDSPPPEHPELPTEEPDVWEEWDSGMPSTGSCPAPHTTEFMGNAISIPFDDFCYGLSTYFRPIFIALAMFAAGFILVGARQ